MHAVVRCWAPWVASIYCSVSKELGACFVDTGPQGALCRERPHGGGQDAAGQVSAPRGK